MHIELIGLLAACCTTFSFLPQIIQIYKTRVTDGISIGMYLIFSTGVLLWLIYGLFLNSPSLIIANGLTLVLAVSVLIMKLIWK